MTTRLVDALAPGRRVLLPTLSNESRLLADELAADPERARGVEFVGVQFPGIDRFDALAAHPAARLTTPFMSPALRRGGAEPRARLVPSDYLGFARELLEGPPLDVAIAHLAPPDADGWCAPGLACDFLPLVWPRARRRVAHVDAGLPRLASTFRVHVDEIDLRVDRPTEPFDWPAPAAGDVERRIADRIARLVRDGDTLQFGIGGVPAAVAAALASHRRLRLHTGMVTATLPALWNAGALDRDATVTTGVVLGDAALRDFVAAGPKLVLADVRETHGLDGIARAVAAHGALGGAASRPTPAVAGRGAAGGVVPSATSAAATTSRFVAINGAIEVDLFGAVNAERAGGVLQAGAGGLPAYAQAAHALPGARLVVALPSVARGGSVSRIVAALDAGSLTTLPRHLADAVVTEHGTAELRGRSLDERADALVAIAAPEHREPLQRAWSSLRERL